MAEELKELEASEAGGDERPDELVSTDLLEDGLTDSVNDLEELVEGGDLEALDRFLSLLHAADLAALFGVLGKDHWPNVISRLNVARISDLMEELPDHLRDDLAEFLEPEELTEAIEGAAKRLRLRKPAKRKPRAKKDADAKGETPTPEPPQASAESPTTAETPAEKPQA